MKYKAYTFGVLFSVALMFFGYMSAVDVSLLSQKFAKNMLADIGASIDQLRESVMRLGESMQAPGATPAPTALSGESLTLLSPNGGEELVRGTKYTIRWASTGDVATVDLHIFRQDAYVQGDLPVDNRNRYYIIKSIPNTGSYVWNVGDIIKANAVNPPDGEYIMRVVKPQTFRTVDDSDAPFLLTRGGPVPTPNSGAPLTITYPNGGEELEAGRTYTLKWATTDIDVKKVNLYIFDPDEQKPCSQDFCEVDLKKRYDIVRGIPNTGEYKWAVPYGVVESGHYVLRVRKADAFRIADDSDTMFSLATFVNSDGSHTPGLNPALGQFSCHDVRVGQSSIVNPRTGEIATQVETRKMVELRIFDCFWRAYRYTEKMHNETSDPAIKAKVKAKLDSARVWQAKALWRMMRDSLRAVNHPTGTWPISRESYVWIYPPNAFANLRQALAFNPSWVKQNPDDGILELIGAALVNNEVVEFKYPPTPQPKKPNTANKRVGMLKGGQQFDPLTPEQLEILDRVEALHMQWTQAALAKSSDSTLLALTMEHHDEHMALESMARNLKEQILLTIPEHGKHAICWDGRSEELTKRLIMETDRLHSLWTVAVKERRFAGDNGSWALGLLHSRANVLLGTCNIGQPKFGDKEIGDRGLGVEVRKPPQVGDKEF